MVELTVVSIEQSYADAPFDNRGRILFQTEPDKKKGGPKRKVVEVHCHAPWAPDAPGVPNYSEGGSVEIDGEGFAEYFFRNGSNPGSNSSYVESFDAYVAIYSDRHTPISNVVEGSLLFNEILKVVNEAIPS